MAAAKALCHARENAIHRNFRSLFMDEISDDFFSDPG
jgi:hypothetical protein